MGAIFCGGGGVFERRLEKGKADGKGENLVSVALAESGRNRRDAAEDLLTLARKAGSTRERE